MMILHFNFLAMIHKMIPTGSLFLILFLTGLFISGCGREQDENNLKNNETVVIENKIAGSQWCHECHGRTDSVKMTGFHKKIDCEKCHGPGSLHLSDPIVYEMRRPSDRLFCTKCHASDSGNSGNIMQIDPDSHNPGKRCISCHNAHTGGFGQPEKNGSAPGSSTCSMCHAKINVTRLKGVHKSVECQSCHAGWEQHLENQKAFKPQKSSERAFCGKCHGKGQAPASGRIKQIDLKEHNPEAKCIECHNAHSPWD
jgi:hypothetical protein